MINLGIPNIVVIASVVLTVNIIVLSFMFMKDKRKRRRTITYTLLLEYLFLIYASTVLFRNHYNSSRVILTPLSSFRRLETQFTPQELFQIIGNLFMLSPLGYILRFIIRTGGYWKSTLIGLLFSVCIELSQYTLTVGTTEIDDVILNTTGCLLGYAVARLLFKKKRREHPAH